MSFFEINPDDHRLPKAFRDFAKFALETLRNIAVVSAFLFAGNKANSEALKYVGAFGLLCLVATFIPYIFRAAVRVTNVKKGSGLRVVISYIFMNIVVTIVALVITLALAGTIVRMLDAQLLTTTTDRP